jgi:hypothetical protein
MIKSILLFFFLLSISSFAQTVNLDMLDWMTMDSFGSYTKGAGAAMWTVMDSAESQFYWVKNSKGYPWDVKKWDANFIYDTITEINWSDPSAYKKHIGPNGKGYPLCPRFVPYVPGSPPKNLSTILIPPSGTKFEIHYSCSNYTVSNLGYAKTEVWGPFYESFGGDLPPNLETLHLNWLWSCDSSYNNCKTKEQFTLAKVYGNVRWNNYQLQNGAYVLLQSSIRNTVRPGTATAVHPCWK